MNEQAFFLSLIAALVVSLPIISIGRKKGMEPEGQRIVREARKAGRVVQATLEKSRYVPGAGGAPDPRQREDRYWLTYRYTVDGVSYTWRTQAVVHADAPPETLTLYYPAGRPDKAVPAGSSRQGVGFGLRILLPFILFFVFYHFVFG